MPAHRVLIVDSKAASREFCQTCLESEGYEIEACHQARRALTFLSTKRFDLILTELSLPDSDGLNFMKQVRYHYPHTSFIVMTPSDSAKSAVESMRAGAYDFITKPFAPDRLRAAVRQCLDSHHLQHQISKKQSEYYKKDKLAAVGGMASAIAHRMRNPLSIILMSAQYLMPRMKANKEYVKMLRTIEEKVRALERLTRDFVGYSRAARVHQSPHPLEMLCDEVLRNCAARFKIQKVKVTRQYAARLPMVYCDASLIKEVITNVIDNGLEAMKGKGQIKIILRQNKKNRQVRLSITNSGGALSSDLEEKVFEPFFTTKRTGIGLGLAIVRQIIENHSGQIQAVGDSLKNTTTFHIDLPIME